MHLQSSSLRKNTSGLKNFELLDRVPEIGKNTDEAITCGIYNSISGGIIQIIKKNIEINNLPENLPVLLTGGSAEKIKYLLSDNFNIIYEKYLVLKGILSLIN